MLGLEGVWSQRGVSFVLHGGVFSPESVDPDRGLTDSDRLTIRGEWRKFLVEAMLVGLYSSKSRFYAVFADIVLHVGHLAPVPQGVILRGLEVFGWVGT